MPSASAPPSRAAPRLLTLPEAVASLLSPRPAAPRRVCVEIHAPVASALSWLRGQACASRVYFRCRERRFEAAGLGCAHVERGDGPFGGEVYTRLRGMCGEGEVRGRFYGGMRFDGEGAVEEEWAAWRRWVFVLPAVEVVREGRRWWVCANFQGGEDVVRDVVAEMRFGGGSVSGGRVEMPIGAENLTSFEEWDEGMREILASLKRGEYEKLVLARRKRFLFREGLKVDGMAVVEALGATSGAWGQVDEQGDWECELEVEVPRERGAYLFCLELDGVAFVGCTPERLFQVDADGGVVTQALAGTVKRGAGGADRAEEKGRFDELCGQKNMEEHRFVVDYIEERLQEVGLTVSVSSPRVIRLPRLMHLATDVRGDGGRREGLTLTLLDAMHPTPAVCGMPRAVTMERLRGLERFDRGYFAGPLGWFSHDASDFCVAIRSALVKDNVVTAYAGSGIVKGSESRSEWDETELKMSAFTDMFCTESTPSFGQGQSLINSGKSIGNGVPAKVAGQSTCLFDSRNIAAEANLNGVWGNVVVEELCRCGLTTFFVCPGSRSAPLAIAVTRARYARLVVVHDERGAAFMALGYSRAARRPAAVITSSGTAVANLLPAVVEASNDKVPLLLLTADRPPELRDVGANQAVDQVKLFGGYVKWEKDIPCPDTAVPLRNLLSDLDHAVYMARSNSGPVHLNFMFREKLAPDVMNWNRDYLRGLREDWTHGTEPLTSYAEAQSDSLGPLTASSHVSCSGAAALASMKSVLVIVGGGVGGGRDLDDRIAISCLAADERWPVLPDVASSMRLEALVEDCVIPHGDLVIASDKLLAAAKIDAILQFGERITSKRVASAVARLAESRPYVVVSPSQTRIDPAFCVSHRFVGSPASFVRLLRRERQRLGVCVTVVPKTSQANGHAISYLHVNGYGASRPPALLDLFLRASKSAQSHLDSRLILHKQDDITEPWIARVTSECLPIGSALFLGNSMPIRDFDSFSSFRPQPRDWKQRVLVDSNRGASGIDGVLSSGIGFAIGCGRATTVVIGDMSFLHDINALHILREHGESSAGIPPITLIVVNNGGGGIFSMLPIAKHSEVFSPVFDTPHGVSFSGVAQMFGLAYMNVKTVDGLRRVLLAANSGHRLVEITLAGSHDAAVAFRRQLVQEITQSVEGALLD